jgi:hypothetical protein
MHRIDERVDLAATAAPRLDATGGRGDTDAPALQALTQPARAAAGPAPDADDGVHTLDANPVHTTLALPEIGLGYASLDSLQDKDVAFIMTADGLTTVTSGVEGYLVKSDVPMDAALTKIMSYAASGGFGEVSKSFADLAITAAADSFDHGHDDGWDIMGAATGDTVAGSAHNDVMHGLAGNDNLDGAAGDDIIWGGVGVDTVLGGDGDDQLWSGAGNDSVDGGLGDDFLFAGSGADTILGGDGADLILGGLGIDSMTGGAGDDVLVGGANADVLTGGEGADIFLFAEGDSGAGATAGDSVTDFTRGEDRLDLTSFTRPLHVVDAFDHHGYEVVMTDRSDGTLIQIDLNGDGVSDQEIVVTTTDHSHLDLGDLVV